MTRQSALAMRQTQMVVDALTQVWPDFQCQIMPMKTSIDDTELPISTFGGKQSFVKELEEVLLSGFADMAIHSLKDMAVTLPQGLVLPAFLPRKEPRDVLITQDFSGLSSLPKGAIVATSSLRRSAQIMHGRRDLQIVPCRGNVDTRLKKLQRGDYDALILAGAGLERLGLEHLIGEYLPVEDMLPACGQGVIAVECRRADRVLVDKLSQINHLETSRASFVERKVVDILGGHCQMPLAVYAQYQEGRLWVRACLGYADGSELIQASCYLHGEGMDQEIATLESMCQDLLDRGGAEVLHAYN